MSGSNLGLNAEDGLDVERGWRRMGASWNDLSGNDCNAALFGWQVHGRFRMDAGEQDTCVTGP